MIVIRTAKPLRKVFLKTGEEIRAFDDEFREEDYGTLENYSTAPVMDEETLAAMLEEKLAEARAQWEEAAEKARDEAVAAAREEAAKEASEQLVGSGKVLQSMIEALNSERDKILRESETVIVDLALKIARKFVGAAAEASSEVIKQTIKSALALVTEKEKLVLRINPADLEEVRAHQDDIVFIGDGIGRLDIRPDKQVRQGGCIVETDAGNIDARIETRLTEMEKALKQAYYIGKDEQESEDAGEPDQ